MRWYPVTEGENTYRLPSVTTVLDVTMPQARRDTLIRSEMTNPVNYAMRREAAMGKGTAVDAWFKASLQRGALLPRPVAVQHQCRRLLPLLRGILRTKSQFWTDEIVYSIPMGVAGTLDVVANLPGGLRAVVELKTSAYTIWPEAIAEAQLQAVAYFLLWNQLHPDRLADAIATYHATPYKMHAQVTYKPEDLQRLTAAWLHRLKHFASRYSQMEL